MTIIESLLAMSNENQVFVVASIALILCWVILIVGQFILYRMDKRIDELENE